jgi:hypothetical protein
VGGRLCPQRARRQLVPVVAAIGVIPPSWRTSQSVAARPTTRRKKSQSFFRRSARSGAVARDPISARHISQYRRTSFMRWQKVGAKTGKWHGGTGMYFVAVIRAIRAVFTHRRYRPELHYMRGPGPKWFERHGR